MQQQSEVLSIYIHHNAYQECDHQGLAPSILGVILADNWKLCQTPGTKFRRLRHTPGQDYRLRIDKLRAVCSIARDPSGQLNGYIHQVAPRGKVYGSDAFYMRLNKFWGLSQAGSAVVNPQHHDIDYQKLDITSADGKKIPNASMNFWLRTRQQMFFDTVLPLDQAHHADGAQLVIGHGPPGSGKTLVACDLAIEGHLDGHKVDIVVPSIGLQQEYERMIAMWGIGKPADGLQNHGVRVYRFAEYSAMWAGKRMRFDRESRLRGWWLGKRGEPAFKAQFNQAAKQLDTMGLSSRVPALLDALLEDDAWWQEYSPEAHQGDPLASEISKIVKLLSPVRDGLVESIEASGTGEEHEIVTRAGLVNLARGRLLKLRGAHAPLLTLLEDKSPRLLIVDEAQDLAPAEWKLLLTEWFRGSQDLGGTSGKLVLLGDMKQRVGLVPFDWADVKRYATEQCNVNTASIAELEVDAASYRMRRRIAEIAEVVWHKKVIGPHWKQHGKIDLDRLLPDGTVEVMLVNKGECQLADMLDQCPRGLKGEYLFAIHGAGDAAPGREDVFQYSIQEVKGLEADRIVVIRPFGIDRPCARDKITGDDATAFYTAVSRAREHVLLVLDDATWDELKRAEEAWATVTPFRYKSLPASKLEELMTSCRVRLSEDEVQSVLIEQLTQLSSQATETDAAAHKRILGVLQRLLERADAGLEYPLIEAGLQLAAEAPATFDRLRAAAAAERAAGNYVLAVGILLYLGEVAVASRVLEEGTCQGKPTGNWNSEWLAEIAKDSHWQQWQLTDAVTPNVLVSTAARVKNSAFGQVRARIESMIGAAGRL
ncbi:MAG: hypothetical protein NTW19_01375 [Planctomycetota bacterium]|nr:hypothetical protein [Planctomycetota bacterium]